MKLKGMDTQSDETIVSSLMSILKKVVSSNNGPYLIFAWTQHSETLKTFEKHLSERGKDVPQPCFIVDMEKSECFDGKKIDYAKVSEKLTKELGDLPVFDFLIDWEKTIGDSSSEVINLLNSMVKKSGKETWANETEKILYCMAKEDSGKHLGETIKLDDSASNVLNSLLNDYIERRAASKDLLKDPSEPPTISDETKAIINTTVHVRHLDNSSGTPAPGNLYILNFADLKKFFEFIPEDENTFKRSFFESTTDLEQIKLCMLEITPICDYTYKKWKCNRFLIGIIVPKAEIDKIWSKTNYLHKTPMLYLEDSPCYIVFDFHYLAGTKFKKLAGLEPNYQFRMDLLSYIQSEMSKHITRPGLFSMD